MGKVHRHNNANKFGHRFNIVTILFCIIYAIFMFTMPFQRGLMIGLDVEFSKSLYVSFILTAFVALALALVKFSHQRIKAISQDNYIQHLIWILPLSSLISQISAVSTYYSNFSTLVLVQAAFFFIVAYSMYKDVQLQSFMFWTIYSVLSLILLFGLMNWFNGATLFGLINPYPDAVWNSGTGKRLTSIFQYPNTYATFLIFFSLISLYGTVMSKSCKLKLLFSLPLVSTFVSLMLTESRWGWLSLPVVFVLTLPFVNIKKQLNTIVLLVITAIATLLVLSPITNWGLELQEQFSISQAFLAWLVVIFSSLIVSILYITYSKLVDKQSETEDTSSIKTQIILPISFAIIGAIGVFALFNSSLLSKILPATIADRFANISLNQHSVLERFTFYRDALAITKDYLLFGTGGGGWSALYQMYQNNPYVSFEVHSYFIQLLLEKGLLGFIVTLALYVWIFLMFITAVFKQKKLSIYSFSMFIIATTILINSALDFHMSYAYTYIFLFIALGGMLATSDTQSSKVNGWLAKLGTKMTSKWITTLYLVGAIIFGCIALNSLTGVTQFEKAKSTLNTIPFNETYDMVATASKKVGHPEMLSYQAQLLNEGYKTFNEPSLLEEATKVILHNEKLEPYDEKLTYDKLNYYTIQGNDLEVIRTLEQAVVYYMWDITYYEKLMTQYTTQLTNAYFDQNVEGINYYINTINVLESQLQDKFNHLKTLPEGQEQGRLFEMTRPIISALGQKLYIEGQYDLAVTYIKQAYDNTYSYDGSVLTGLYYAALQQKLGEDHTQLVNELQSDIDDVEKLHAQIDFLVQSNPHTP